MKNFLLKICVVLALVLPGTPYAFSSENIQPKRVVSLSPSATEMLYALGLADQVIGVTKFCRYPPQAKEKPQIGGFLDPNYEMIFRLAPDVLVTQRNKSQQKETFQKMGIETLEIDTHSIEGVVDSILRMGDYFGQEVKAREIVNAIKTKVDDVRLRTKDLPRPKVLVTFTRPLDGNKIREVHIAGNDVFFNELIDITGGANAYQGGQEVIMSPMVSAEGILQMNPDIIIEVMTQLSEADYNPEDFLDDWQSLPDLQAVKNKKLYIFSETYASIPGPRLGLIIDDMARIIHPDIFP